MKNLSKIIGILLFAIASVNIQAENIDECKSDLYFANGIMMKDSEKNAEKKWRLIAKKLLSSNLEAYAKIANVKMSYNVSQGFLDDLLESFEQVMSNEWGWRDFTLFFSAYLTEKGIQEDWVPHIKDLVKQTNSYKESIKLGHNVIVVAHSQGNYYTNEAYDLLDTWMKPYFHMMGVATPANHVAGDGPYVTFHNDMIKSIATGLPTNRDNPNLNHNSVFSVEAHDFYTSYMTANNTRAEIQNFILNQVTEHEKSPSQWETDQEFELNTCDYKITVKHRYDPSVEMAEKVYPFAANKKLYKVKGEWVKASCGGKNILEHWEGKKDNECWLIDNPQKEKIVRRLRKHGFSIFSSFGSSGTCNSRVPIRVYTSASNVNLPYVYGTENGHKFYDNGTGKETEIIEFTSNSCKTVLKKIVLEERKSHIALIYADEKKALKVLQSKYGEINVEIMSNSITLDKCFSYGRYNLGYSCNFVHNMGGYVHY